MANVVYIEVGSIRTKMALVRGGKKENQLEAVLSFPTPHGAVEDGIIRDTGGVGSRIRTELDKNGFRKVRRCVFTVFSGRIASREIDLPYVHPSKLGSMVETNAGDYFPVDLSKYVLTYQILRVDEKEGGKTYHLAVYAAPRALTSSYLETAGSAGLSLMKIDYLGNGAYQSLKCCYPAGLHVQVKIESEASMLTIVKDGNLALQRVLNYGIGGSLETLRNLKGSQNLDADDALKMLSSQRLIRSRIGEEISAADGDMLQASAEVTDALRFLCSNIQRILDYYLSRNTKDEIETLEISGTGALCRGLDQLLSNELMIQTGYSRLPDTIRVKDSVLSEEEKACFEGVIGSCIAPLNLMEKVKKGQKAVKAESLKGSLVVLGVSAAACVVLCVGGFLIYGYQKLNKSSLEDKIEELKPMESLYQDYMDAVQYYGDFKTMYGYTETPNEGLADFMEEMEDKMPSSIRIATFQADKSGISMTCSLDSKDEAAKVLLQLRTFESLADVTTSGLSVDENGDVTMSVTAVYAAAAEGQEVE